MRGPQCVTGRVHSADLVWAYDVVGPFRGGGVLAAVGVESYTTIRGLVRFGLTVVLNDSRTRENFESGVPLLSDWRVAVDGERPYTQGMVEGIQEHGQRWYPMWRSMEVGPFWLCLALRSSAFGQSNQYWATGIVIDVDWLAAVCGGGLAGFFRAGPTTLGALKDGAAKATSAAEMA